LAPRLHNRLCTVRRSIFMRLLAWLQSIISRSGERTVLEGRSKHEIAETLVRAACGSGERVTIQFKRKKGCEDVPLPQYMSAHASGLDVCAAVAEKIFIPFSVGGGLGSVADMRAVLLAGAEKVSVNSAAVRLPRIITDGASLYGSQCIVLGMDARRASSTMIAFSGLW
jgi:hypothetical protein